MGGPDPSMAANYQELSPLSTGINSIAAGPGISVDNTNPNVPIVGNAGVRTLAGDGVSILVDNTDPNNPIITSTAVTQITQGAGISVDNTNPQQPVVTNAGVRSLAPLDASVTVSAPTGAVAISANGVANLVPGPGIGLSGALQNLQIFNTGVVSLTVQPGSGLSSTGGSNPTIANTGVLTLAAADTSIIVGGTAQNRTIRTSAPVLTRAFNYGFNSPPGLGPVAPGAALTLPVVTPASPNIFTDYLNTGAPDATGIFIIDLTDIIIRFVAAGAPSVVQNVFSVSFRDATNAVTYTSATILNQSLLVVGTAFPITSGLGKVYFNVADARALGFRNLQQVLISNATNGDLVVSSAVQTYAATYYPSGLQ